MNLQKNQKSENERASDGNGNDNSDNNTSQVSQDGDDNTSQVSVAVSIDNLSKDEDREQCSGADEEI